MPETILRCPDCDSENIRYWEYDYGMDPETGYRDTGERGKCLDCGFDAELCDFKAICLCRPCPDCAGEGRHEYMSDRSPSAHYYEADCETCKGSGKLSEECPVHAPLEAPAEPCAWFDGDNQADTGTRPDHEFPGCLPGRY